jgi:hypothetical protein
MVTPLPRTFNHCVCQSTISWQQLQVLPSCVYAPNMHMCCWACCAVTVTRTIDFSDDAPEGESYTQITIEDLRTDPDDIARLLAERTQRLEWAQKVGQLQPYQLGPPLSVWLDCSNLGLPSAFRTGLVVELNRQHAAACPDLTICCQSVLPSAVLLPVALTPQLVD